MRERITRTNESLSDFKYKNTSFIRKKVEEIYIKYNEKLLDEKSFVTAATAAIAIQWKRGRR